VGQRERPGERQRAAREPGRPNSRWASSPDDKKNVIGPSLTQWRRSAEILVSDRDREFRRPDHL
jgi:hypothetical protein